jgi:NTP pyrophosphatase (non-canonical NTP hydrolase)
MLHPPALQPHVTHLAERAMTRHAIAERATTAATRATTSGPAAFTLPHTAGRIADRLREHFTPATLPVQQVLALAEEAGEFTAAYRRWAGLARRTGTWHDVCAELADVVITAYITADVLGIDLDAAARAKTEVVFTRGWREPPPAA